MPIDFINDDLTFKPGFEQHLPAEVRDYAKDAKDPLPGVYAGRHEAIHVLLAPLIEAVAKAGKTDTPEVVAAEHALLNTIYALGWPD